MLQEKGKKSILQKDQTKKQVKEVKFTLDTFHIFSSIKKRNYNNRLLQEISSRGYLLFRDSK